MTLILNGTDNSATTPAVTGTDTDTGVYYPAANQVAIATSGTQAMLANASQGVQFANAIGVGATTPTTSGAGITFPATQSASTNANTLDDYEEGTWTPTINLLGTLTYGAQNGTYVKVGGLVTVSLYVIVSSTDTTQDGSIMSISGLPFTATADSGYACLMTERMSGTNSPTAPNTFFGQVGNGGASLNLFQNNYNGTATNASYFVSQVRSGYKGANMYVLGLISYRAS